MKKINIKSVFGNKATTVAFIAAIFLLAQQVLAMFGITWDYSVLLTQVTGVVGTVFALAAMLGIAVNPTTPGIGEPDDKKDEEDK
jgi:phi LC3 family holin